MRAAVGILEKRSFNQMSVSDLAEEAGISVGTIYQYVESKEDVLVMVIVDILEAYRNAITPVMAEVSDPVERLHEVFRAYCGVVNSRRSAVVLGYGASRAIPTAGRRKIMELETHTTGLLAECVQAGADAKVFEVESSDLVAWDLAILAHAWALKHWYLSKIFTLDEYVEIQWRTALRSLTLQ